MTPRGPAANRFRAIPMPSVRPAPITGHSSRMAAARCWKSTISIRSDRPFVPELTNKWRGNQLVVGDWVRNQPICAGKLVQAVNSFRRDVRIVERRISCHQAANQRSFFRREKSGPHFCGERRIRLERLLSLYNCPYRGSGDLRLLVDEPVGRCQRREIVQARSRRAITPPQIEMDFCNAKLLADCGTHAVAPVSVRTSLDGVNAVMAAPQLVFAGGRTRNDLNLVTFEIDSCFGQHVSESHVGKCRGRRNPQPFDGIHIAAFDVEIGANGHEPVGILSQRAQEPRPLPAREGSGRTLGGAAEKAQRSVAQTFVPAPCSVYELQLGIDPFFLEKTELDRGSGHEVRRRIHVSSHQAKHSTQASKTRSGSIVIGRRFSWQRSSRKARRPTEFQRPARTGSFRQRSLVRSQCRNKEGRAGSTRQLTLPPPAERACGRSWSQA